MGPRGQRSARTRVMPSLFRALLVVAVFVGVIEAFNPARGRPVVSFSQKSCSVRTVPGVSYESSSTVSGLFSKSYRHGRHQQDLSSQVRLFSSASKANNGEEAGNKSGRRRRRALAKFLAASSSARGITSKVLSKARAKVMTTLQWTRRKRRNMLAAAALLLSAVSFSQQHQPAIATASSTAPSMASNAPQVVRLASSGSNSAAQYQSGRSGSTDRLVLGKTQIGRAGGSTVSARAKATPKVQLASNTPDGGIGAGPTSLIAKKQSHSVPPMAAVLGRSKKSKATTEAPPKAAVEATERTIREAMIDLAKYMEGPKSDTLILLLATALVTPLCMQVGISPILGFLAAGMMLGPNAAGLISGIHTTETLAELGIVFFLFEMGIELSFDRLKSMKRDVFGLGLTQFLGTAATIAAIGKLAFNLPGNALVVLGGGLALSSSAFVLQLLKDKNQLATRFGKASFGVLLLQDLAVVPLLVVTPLLAGGGQGLGAALGSALVKATIALSSIAFAGRVVLNPLFNTVAKAKTQEAFLGVILLTVLAMSFMTEGLGLSNTLGAFLAGVLLSETKYRYQIEADIAPFRGVLLGLFFVTVGFEIDVGLVLSQLPLVSAVVLGIIAVKATVAALASMAFGLSLSTSLQTGLIVSQAGEFAFVAFGLARSLGIFDKSTTKFLLTCVSLTMALTPFLASLGGKIAKRIEEGSDSTHYLGQDREAMELKESDDFVIVIGYGTVGKVVTDLLDRKFIRYQCLEVDPNKAIEARNKGLPVFYGDVGRPEVAEAFNVGKANAVIVTISDKAEANRAIIALRRMYPDMKIFARAYDADHAQRLQKTLDVAAMVPIIPEDNVLLTLPFGGAVLKSLGALPEEVNAILESKRKDVLSGRGLAESEEETALMQLGIMPDDDSEEEEAVDVVEAASEEVGNDHEDEVESVEAAAKDAIQEIKSKSPMVAEVIEANISTPDKKQSPQSSPSDEDLEKTRQVILDFVDKHGD